MSPAGPDIADIDAAIARGEWWARLFEELSDQGLQRAQELPLSGGAGLDKVVREAERIFRAVRLAVVAAMRLGQILAGLADLRNRSAADLAAARARARAKAEEDDAVRERRAETAQARRAARDVRETEIDRTETDGAERDAPEGEFGPKAEHRDRDPLVEALDKRLAAVDPAIVDFDDLQLRETVLRICADLGITPDWNRWEAGQWATPDPTDAPRPPAAARGASIPPRGCDRTIEVVDQNGRDPPHHRERRPVGRVTHDLMELGARYSALPDADTRGADEILGYDENGLPT